VDSLVLAKGSKLLSKVGDLTYNTGHDNRQLAGVKSSSEKLLGLLIFDRRVARPEPAKGAENQYSLTTPFAEPQGVPPGSKRAYRPVQKALRLTRGFRAG
jgi:hypothetical protein